MEFYSLLNFTLSCVHNKNAIFVLVPKTEGRPLYIDGTNFTLSVSGEKALTRAGSSKSLTSLILSAVPGSMNDEITYSPRRKKKKKHETAGGGGGGTGMSYAYVHTTSLSPRVFFFLFRAPTIITSMARFSTSAKACMSSSAQTAAILCHSTKCAYSVRDRLSSSNSTAVKPTPRTKISSSGE